MKRLNRFSKFVDFVFELKYFLFNFFVIDLSLAAFYEIAAADIFAVFKYGEAHYMIIVSYVLSHIVLIFLLYDFWELYVAADKLRISATARTFKRIMRILAKRE